MKNFKIVIFFVIFYVAGIGDLYAQKLPKSVMESLIHGDWVWQVSTNFLVYTRFNHNEFTQLAYLPESDGLTNTCIAQYYLSDSIPTAFDYDKVGKNEDGRYWVVSNGKSIPTVIEILEITKDKLVLRYNRSKVKMVFKRTKKKNLNKFLDRKGDIIIN